MVLYIQRMLNAYVLDQLIYDKHVNDNHVQAGAELCQAKVQLGKPASSLDLMLKLLLQVVYIKCFPNMLRSSSIKQI